MRFYIYKMVVIICKSVFKYICKYFIKIGRYFCEILLSLPSRKCGLKFGIMKYRTLWMVGHFPRGSVGWNRCVELYGLAYIVTSLAEVWVEISGKRYGKRCSMSLPSRKCGLKLGECSKDIVKPASLPSRKCGLKLELLNCLRTLEGHFPRGSVGWNSLRQSQMNLMNRHFPRGSVGWNMANIW